MIDDRKGRPYSQSPNTVRSTVLADVGIGPYGALLHLFVGRDAHIAPSNNALFSTVDIVSGSGAKRKSIRHTKRNQPRSANAW